jgi:RNA polymerase sigma factor (sigma-70 family)
MNDHEHVRKYNALWEKFIAGGTESEEAFGLLYNGFVNPLFVFGQYFSSNEELIKDCVQDVFIRLYVGRRKLKPVENVKLYLYISLKNTIFNALKKENRFTNWPDTAEQADFEQSSEDSYIENENLILQERRLSKTMEQLTPRQREALYYRYMEEFSYDDICQLMQMNYQSVRNLLSRTIAKLKKLQEEQQKQA